MLTRFNTWLHALPYPDSVQRSQASTLQAFLLIFIGGGLAGLVIQTSFTWGGSSIGIELVAYALSLAFEGACLALLRTGRLALSASLLSYGLILTYSVVLLAVGFDHSGLIAITYVVPITLAGMVIGRKSLFAATGLSIFMVVTLSFFEWFAPKLIGFVQIEDSLLSLYIFPFTLIMIVFALALDRFNISLRAALHATQRREEELKQLRASLEATVAERTATLQQTVDNLQTSQATIQALGTPMLPVLPGVLVLPLIGTLNQARMDALNQQVLDAIAHQRAQHIIVDITSVALVDTYIATALLHTFHAMRLLGAHVLLVGIRAEVAQTIVALGVDLGAVTIYQTLQDAVLALLTTQDCVVTPSGGWSMFSA